MKVYSIGREMGCDVVIDDNTDVISRRHAIVTVDNVGKMTITDQSQNGTYVNGIRISSNVAVPVTRKDIISFAQISRLDWKLIPNPINKYKYILASVLGIVILGLIIWSGMKLFGDDKVEDLIETSVVDQKEETSNKEENDNNIEKKEEGVKTNSVQSKTTSKRTTKKNIKEKEDAKEIEKTETKKATRIR